MISFQQRCYNWARKCFGDRVATDTRERSLRFVEEALEFVQARELSKEDVLMIVEHVYSRPVGNVKQELGGVMVTLGVMCEAAGLDFEYQGEMELQRCNGAILNIRAKHATKQKQGIGIKSDLPNA